MILLLVLWLLLDHADTSAPLNFVEQVRQQIPIWRADTLGQYENAEIDAVAEDLRLWDGATDQATKDALEDNMKEDWHALEAADLALKGNDVI